METILATIDDCKQTADIVDAYKLAANALRQTNAVAGITVDKVDDVMLDVQESLDDHNDAQQAMGQTKFEAVGADPIDEAELDAELADLLVKEQQKKHDASIERRMQELDMGDLGDLSPEEQQQIVDNVLVMRRQKEADPYQAFP